MQVAGFHFDTFSMGLFGFWASLAVIMLLRSVHTIRSQTALHADLLAAREVQRVLVSGQSPVGNGWKVETVYEPAQQIGGDFFQVVSDGAKGVLLVIGDVSGKGIPAAMLVGVIIGTIRALVHLSREPLTILSGLNQHLVGMTGNAFATAAVVRIQHDGDVSLANAGHLPPYFNGEPLDVPGSLPLGIDRNASYLPTAFHLNCGDRLTFYSDGVIEAQSPTGELFGFDRAGNISMSSAREIARQVQDFGQQDDITIVTVDRLCVGAGLSHSADFVTDRSL